MKKNIILYLLMIVCLFSLVVNAADKIVLNYWTHTDDNRTLIENRYIKEFEEKYPNVEIRRVVNEASKMGDLVLTAFSANNGPDVFNLPIEQEYGYMINGRVAPVDFRALGYSSFDELKKNYMENTFGPVTMDGNIYGLPLELTNWAIFINKKVFRDAGLDPEKDFPKTWEDMVNISEKLVLRDGEIITRRGFDFRYPYYLVSFLPMVQQLGGDLLSPDGKTAIVNDEAWIKALKFIKDWGPHGKNLGSPTYVNARKTFNKDNNDIAMCLSGLYQEGRLRDDNPDFYNSGEWMVVPFPVFENAKNNLAAAYYGHYLMVNSQISNEKQEMAWKFIDYMLSHPVEYLKKVNIVQPTQDLIESKAFKNMPYSNVFMEDLARAKPVFLHQNGYQFERYIKEAIESVMLQGTSVDGALKYLGLSIQEVLDEEY
ncbi:extracellular solute-binding protein [Halocella sp. SP3-1]|uniref:extracellular solute-binding protein n=1 Tax=Halocella sp. SP3-1 TaxID=2382161 RepID=UPI000F75238F|nr:extracellular solute-binding protein [Halocella sp. SP3-1]AZO93417.1 extracellular solute-binding protein [Halocella sp. SP3-1]